jgi:hypothetical protein
MVWELFLLVNEKYNPITQERQKLALLRRFNLQRVDTRGEQYRKGLNREAQAHCGFDGVTWPVSPGFVLVIPDFFPDLAPEVLETGGQKRHGRGLREP